MLRAGIVDVEPHSLFAVWEDVLNFVRSRLPCGHPLWYGPQPLFANWVIYMLVLVERHPIRKIAGSHSGMSFTRE